MIAALPLAVLTIVAGGAAAAVLSWPVTPGRHRMPERAGRHRVTPIPFAGWILWTPRGILDCLGAYLGRDR